MALQDPQGEPSMEEILASIRRIISEEEQAAPEPVLDLTQTEAPAEQSAEDDIVFETAEEPPPPSPRPSLRRAPPQPEAPAPAPPTPAVEIAAVEGEPDAMVSPPTATAAAGALARLAGSLKISEAPNQTLEGMVRELLRPMLKEWLERNLPTIVEARVEAELERIARLVR